MLNIKTKKTKKLILCFILLLGLFIFRVVAQLLQYFLDLTFLPPFESWDSGILSYKFLFTAQILTIFVLSKTIYKIALDKIVLSIKTGYIFITLGTLYFAIMFFRLIAGLTLLQDVKWFAYPIPSFFHLVLACFLVLFGYFHLLNKGGGLNNA
ncbi:MAG TPA: hypothetical protein VLB82_02570 [Thermodesulfobacteriota bacterium]|nr:hypothetical protein [Thermodesulfobacteriota bacterium]